MKEKEKLLELHSGKLLVKSYGDVLRIIKILLPDWMDSATFAWTDNIDLRIINDYSKLDEALNEKGLKPFLYLCPKRNECFQPKSGFEKPVSLFGANLNELQIAKKNRIVLAAMKRIFKDGDLIRAKRKIYDEYSNRATRYHLGQGDSVSDAYLVEFDNDFYFPFFSVAFAEYVTYA